MIYIFLLVIILLLFVCMGLLAYIVLLIKRPESTHEYTEQSKPKKTPQNRGKSKEEIFFENFLSYDGDPQPELTE